MIEKETREYLYCLPPSPLLKNAAPWHKLICFYSTDDFIDKAENIPGTPHKFGNRFWKEIGIKEVNRQNPNSQAPDSILSLDVISIQNQLPGQQLSYIQRYTNWVIKRKNL